MARQHNRKKRSGRRPPASSLAVLAATLLSRHAYLTLATATNGPKQHDDAADTSSIRKNEEAEGSLHTTGHNNIITNRRGLRAEGSLSTVNLLVKYKHSEGHRRSLENFNNGVKDVWQSHAKSISTLSDSGHISEVKIDPRYENVELIWKEMLDDDDIELVEEDFIMSKYPTTIENIEDLHLRHKKKRQLADGEHTNSTMNRVLAEDQQYGVEMTQADEVWALVQSRPNKYPSEPVKVCIVDTGYDVNHEDLPKSGVVTVTDTGFGSPLIDGDGHGTHCAGVIGAIGGNDRGIVGVNPNGQVRFHISKALNDEGMGTASSVIRGIEGCVASGAKIINMSLGGGPDSKMFDGMFEDAYDEGIITFAASGNVGLDQDDYPASYPHVVSVGAVDKRGEQADFSNWSDQTEIMGPGQSIMSTYPNNRYATLSGTSMATPYVAGVAALVWSYFPECSNQQIRNVLASSAKTITSNPSGCSRRSGFGLVQAKDAFDMLDKYGCAAGGPNYNPPRRGGVGGCGQPLVDVSTLVPLSQQQARPVNQLTFVCKRLMLKMRTDGYAYEQSWTLEKVNADGTREVIGEGPPGPGKYEDNTDYNGAVKSCLGPGTYEFHMMDLFGDGMSGTGYYELSMDGKRLKRNSQFGYKETTTFTIDNSGVPSIKVPRPVWKSIVFEGFSNGLGSFRNGGNNAMFINTKFNRYGMVMIKNGASNNSQASVYSQRIALNTRSVSYSQFKTVFSFFANGAMGLDGKFCLDYQVNGGTNWIRAKCWKNGRDFQTGKWTENESVIFKPEAVLSNNIRIRICSDSPSNMDRVFIDKIQLLGSTI